MSDFSASHTITLAGQTVQVVARVSTDTPNTPDLQIILPSPSIDLQLADIAHLSQVLAAAQSNLTAFAQFAQTLTPIS